MSDMLEIEAAKIAQQKGNADEKTFAAQMITDHTKTSSELKGMVVRRSEGGAPDVRLTIPRRRSSTSCEMPSRKISRREYDPMQVSAHKDATSLFERYAKGGDDPKLKDWAGKDAPRPAASSRDGAGHEQEPQITIESRPSRRAFLLVSNA